MASDRRGDDSSYAAVFQTASTRWGCAPIAGLSDHDVWTTRCAEFAGTEECTSGAEYPNGSGGRCEAVENSTVCDWKIWPSLSDPASSYYTIQMKNSYEHPDGNQPAGW